MNQTHLGTVLTQAQQLSLLDKVRLVERLMSTLERDLQPPSPRRSLLGLWSDGRIAAEANDAARREMWGSLPCEDV